MFATATAPYFLPLWISWLVLFAIFEAAAFIVRLKSPDNHQTNDGGTLSELVWRIIRGSAWYHRLAFFVLLAVWSWLTYHFFLTK